MKLADAEKLKGNNHWTIYDGRGGVWHGQRDKSSGWWNGYKTNGEGCCVGRTLRELRQIIAR